MLLPHLDLGCAGGGLVWDFLTGGHEFRGVKGSDFSHRSRRAYWRVADADARWESSWGFHLTREATP